MIIKYDIRGGKKDEEKYRKALHSERGGFRFQIAAKSFFSFLFSLVANTFFPIYRPRLRSHSAPNHYPCLSQPNGYVK